MDGLFFSLQARKRFHFGSTGSMLAFLFLLSVQEIALGTHFKLLSPGPPPSSLLHEKTLSRIWPMCPDQVGKKVSAGYEPSADLPSSVCLCSKFLHPTGVAHVSSSCLQILCGGVLRVLRLGPGATTPMISYKMLEYLRDNQRQGSP